MSETPQEERGLQRRKSTDGRLLHCCCICLKLAPWGAEWSYFASLQEIDEGKPYPKFCSFACQIDGGPNAESVTVEMKRAARDREWREPRQVYRPPSYADAVDRQYRIASRFAERGDRGLGSDAS